MGAFYESDCSDLEHSNGGLWVETYTSYQFPNTDPLSRYDPVYPVTYGSTPNTVGFYGEDPVTDCDGTGYVFPDLQEINYSTDNGANWIGGTSSSSLTYVGVSAIDPPFVTLATLGEGYVDPYGALELEILGLPTTGTLLYRVRNIVFNSEPAAGDNYPIPDIGVNCSAGVWSPPVSLTY